MWAFVKVNGTVSFHDTARPAGTQPFRFEIPAETGPLKRHGAAYARD
jgi:hypothetical protein